MSAKKICLVVAKFIFLLSLTLITLGPFLWALVSSFKTQGELLMKPWAMPSSLCFKNYVDAWKMGRFASYFFNSIEVTVFSLLLMIGISAMAAFALNRYNLKSNKHVLLYFLFGQMIGAAMVIFPLTVILQKIGLQDSHLGVCLVYAAGGVPFTVFVLSSFFNTVPKELFDAAEIDGCTEMQMFGIIAVPLVKSGFATVILYQFMWVWNEFTIGFTLIKTPDKRTLPVGLFTAVYGLLETNYVVAFAGTVIVSVPTILMYLVFQKYLIKGITSGAIKG